MTRIEPFLQSLTTQLERQDFVVEEYPVMDGLRGLLYARSRKPSPLIFSRVVEHFLFIDWEEHLASRKERMIEAYTIFNRQVNSRFRVPNVWRLTIPGMVLVAVSQTGFDGETLSYVQNSVKVPFKGGEAGQFMLVDLLNGEVTSFQAFGYKQPAEAPLCHAQDVLIPILENGLRETSVTP